MNNRVELIKSRIEQALTPAHLHIEDDSAKHIGHAGAKDGAGHFNITIVSSQFNNKSLLQRHKLVYAALDDLMKTEIHALSIKAITPEEQNK